MNYKVCVCAGAMQTHRYATSSKEAKPNTTTRRLSSLVRTEIFQQSEQWD